MILSVFDKSIKGTYQWMWRQRLIDYLKGFYDLVGNEELPAADHLLFFYDDNNSHKLVRRMFMGNPYKRVLIYDELLGSRYRILDWIVDAEFDFPVSYYSPSVRNDKYTLFAPYFKMTYSFIPPEKDKRDSLIYLAYDTYTNSSYNLFLESLPHYYCQDNFVDPLFREGMLKYFGLSLIDNKGSEWLPATAIEAVQNNCLAVSLKDRMTQKLYEEVGVPTLTSQELLHYATNVEEAQKLYQENFVYQHQTFMKICKPYKWIEALNGE